METNTKELNIPEQSDIPSWEAPLLIKEKVGNTEFDLSNIFNNPEYF